MKSYTVIGLLATFTSLTAFCGGVSISNIQASQRSKDTGSVDITFDLSADSNKVSVILSAMNTDNNQKVRMNAVYDEAGNFLGNPAKVEPGNGRHLVWNSALDLGKGFYSSAMVVTVRATEYELPLSRIQQYISDKETESQLLQEARTNAPIALAQAEQALTTANAAVKDAEEDLEAVQYTNLKEAAVKAGLAAVAASNAWEDAKYYCAVTNGLYNKSEIAYTKAIYMETNVNATIIWKNSSQDETTNKVVGCTAIEAFVIAHNDFTLIKMETVIPGLYGEPTCTTWEQCTALVKKFRDATEAAEKALKAAEDDLEKAQAAVVKTAAAKVSADDAYTAAQNNLANITSLQYTAEKALEKAEAAQAVAQAAYDDAGCEE